MIRFCSYRSKAFSHGAAVQEIKKSLITMPCLIRSKRCHQMLLLVAVYFLAVCNFALSHRCVHSTLIKMTAKLENSIQQYEAKQVPVNRRTLVIFHIGDLGLTLNSLDVASNNLKIFLGSVEMHGKGSLQKAFYLFNVIDEYNPLLGLIPLSRANVAMLKWTNASSDLEIHLRTLQLLGANVTDKFNSIIFGNQGMRGPLQKRENGEWIGAFTSLLSAHNVALVGPTISCEVLPHVQTHMFAVRTDIVRLILSDMTTKLSATYKSWKELITSLEVGLTGVVMGAGYNVSSFLYNVHGQPYFQRCLNYTGPPNRFDQNPTGWCGVNAEDLLFVKWGGEPMRTPGMVCNTSLHRMGGILEQLARTEPALNLIIPEVLMGGPMYPLFKEYEQEAYLDKTASNAILSQLPENVCFLVRVLKPRQYPHTIIHENPNTWLLNKEIELLITTLRRQTSPNWRALFYRIDNEPSDDALAATLRAFADARLEHVRSPHNTTYTLPDSGYAATDAVLRSVMLRRECKWISITSSDNAYGSQVVERILKYQAGNAALLMNPADSRRFMEQDMLFQKRFTLNKENRLEEYCGMLPRLEQTGLTFGMRPAPSLDGTDLAFAFILRKRWHKEKLWFEDFADAAKFPCLHAGADPVGYKCLSNQGVYFLSHVVQRQLWEYARLPLDGLRSVVFHGHSPTLCIGSGNVWIDHSDLAQQRCITPKDALSIDVHPTWRRIYDMPHFFQQGQLVGTCLRQRQSMDEYAASTVHKTETLSAKLRRGWAWYLRWLQHPAAAVGGMFL